MRRSTSQKASSARTTALTAVALQDHWMRSLSLADPIGPRNIPAKKKNWKKTAKPVVDTGLARPVKKPNPVEKEYVLDAKPPPLTLAQRLGLMERPAELLTEAEWHEAKQQSQQRHDSADPCVICKEDFGTQEQVLLSCTHVFHRNCLEAFERFSGKKTCPMCRKEQYQKRVIYEGAREYRTKCATRIQAMWRGYVVRCWYRKLRETVPPKDPKLRKTFYEDRLSSITERLVRSVDVDVGAFLSQIDDSVAASRDVFRHFDNMHRIVGEEEWESIQLQAVQRGHTDCPICLTPLEAPGYRKPQPHHTPPLKTKSSATANKSPRKIKLLPKHPDVECAADFNDGSAGDGGERGGAGAGEGASRAGTGGRVEPTRQSVLLSCSHVFHFTCLEAFEEFAEGDRKYVCPVCRAVYQKKVL